VKPGTSPSPDRRVQIRYWLRQSASVLWLAAAALYLSILAGRAVYHNYQSQQQTDSLQQQLIGAERERDRLKALIVYYNTDDYKEKELRRALLLKDPEETVYALPESWDEPSLDNQTPIIAAAIPKASTVPIWRQWYEYVAYGKKK
jgi:cell division protein FtsB